MDKTTKNNDTNNVGKEENRASVEAEMGGEWLKVEAITLTSVSRR